MYIIICVAFFAFIYEYYSRKNVCVFSDDAILMSPELMTPPSEPSVSNKATNSNDPSSKLCNSSDISPLSNLSNSTATLEKVGDISHSDSVYSSHMQNVHDICSDGSHASTSITRKSKYFTCTFCGALFKRATHLRGPHEGHKVQCPRHPEKYVSYDAASPSATVACAGAHQCGDVVDGDDSPTQSNIYDAVNAPASGAGHVQDNGEGDIDEGILFRTDRILLKEIRTNIYQKIFRNVSYRVYFKEGYIGGDLKVMQDEIRGLFQSIFDNLDFLHPQDQVRIFIDSEESLSVPITVSIRPWCVLRLEDVLGEIERRVSSREQVLIGSDFSIDIGIYRPIKAGIYSRPLLGQFRTVEAQIKSNAGSYIYIENDDLSCMPQSILYTYLNSIKLSNTAFQTKYGMDVFNDHKKGDIVGRLEKSLALGACTEYLYTYIIKRRHLAKFRERWVYWLLNKCGLPHNVAGTMNDIAAYENTLHCRVHVMTVGDKYGFITEAKDPSDTRSSIYILLNQVKGKDMGHFHGIRFISNVFGRRHFCHVCGVAFHERGQHSCKASCFQCGRQNLGIDLNTIDDAEMDDIRARYCFSTPGDINVVCKQCNGLFSSEQCFNGHKSSGNRRSGGDTNSSNAMPPGSFCHKFWYCNTTCRKRYTRKEMESRQHICFEYFCKRCCIMVNEEGHYCHLRPSAVPKRKAHAPRKYIFYDVEVEQSASSQCHKGYSPRPKTGCTLCHGLYKCRSCALCKNCGAKWCGHERSKAHRPVFIAAKNMCTLCFDPDNVELSMNSVKCTYCSPPCDSCFRKTREQRDECLTASCCARDHTWAGADCLDKFGGWLFNEKNRNAIAIAHNFSQYDGYLILSYLAKKGTPPTMVMSGNKLMSARDRQFGIQMLDSLLFIPLALSKMPAAFGLEHLMHKGYFAHFFTNMETLHYRGPQWPSPEHYGCDNMSTEARRNFMTWHQDKCMSNEIYDHFEELSKYCLNDVFLLSACGMSYTCIMLDLVGVAPFTVATTMAGLALKIFRMFHLRAQYKVVLHDGRELQVYKRGPDIYNVDPQSGERLETLSEGDIAKKTFQKSDIAYLNRGKCTGHHTKFSKESLEWLKYRDSLLPPHAPKMRSVLHPSGEFVLVGTHYSLDGYVPELNIALDYNGCDFHGCVKCFGDVMNIRRNPLNQQTMAQLKRRTDAKRAYIRKNYPHYTYIEMWGCQWKK